MSTIQSSALLRDISTAEQHLRKARQIITVAGPVNDLYDLYTHLEAAQHAAFDAKEHVTSAFRNAITEEATS